MTKKTKHPPRGSRAFPSAKKRNILPFVLLGVGALLAVIVGILVLYKPGDQSSPTNTPVQVTGKPRVALDKTQIDFGQVKLGKTVQATFQISNAGDQPLKIVEQPLVEVQRGCWPPEAVVGSTTIKPGDSTELSMQFMMHEGMDGPHDFRVKLKTNDPETPEVELTVLSDWVQ